MCCTYSSRDARYRYASTQTCSQTHSNTGAWCQVKKKNQVSGQVFTRVKTLKFILTPHSNLLLSSSEEKSRFSKVAQKSNLYTGAVKHSMHQSFLTNNRSKTMLHKIKPESLPSEEWIWTLNTLLIFSSHGHPISMQCNTMLHPIKSVILNKLFDLQVKSINKSNHYKHLLSLSIQSNINSSQSDHLC